MTLYAVRNDKTKEYFRLDGIWVKKIELNCLFFNLNSLKEENLPGKIVTYDLSEKKLSRS